MKLNSRLLYLLPIACVVFFSYLARRYQLDDALIYLRYIKNFQDGLGLVYNPGEKFNGLTSPLFSYVLVVATFFNKNLQMTTIGVSALFLTIAAIVGGNIFSKSRLEAVATACLIASFQYFYSTFGMETSLFLMLIGLSLYLYKVQNPFFIITLALVVITRNEGVFLVIPIACDYLFRFKKLPNLKFVALGAIILIIPFIINYLYYGHLFPVTGAAKIGQGKSGLWGDKWIFLHFDFLFRNFFRSSWLSVIFFASFALYGVISILTNKIANIAVIFTLLLFSFYTGLNIPDYHWYYAPFIYLSLIFACRGFWLASSILFSGGVRHIKFAFFLLIIYPITLYSLSHVISFERAEPNKRYVEIGNWMRSNTPSSSSVAMVEIGTVGFYADRKIIDILGLVNNYNADFIATRQFYSWLTRYQPDYILRHDPIWGHEQSVSFLEKNSVYVPVTNFNFPGFVLLQKSDKFSNAQVASMALKREKLRTNFSELLATSKIVAPYVMLEPNYLFAHAPSNMTLKLKHLTQGISVSYGLKEGAAGNVKGVCFEIKNMSNGMQLMHDCVDSTTPEKDLVRTQLIKFVGNKNDQLTFSTLCNSSCAYGWAYWSNIELNE